MWWGPDQLSCVCWWWQHVTNRIVPQAQPGALPNVVRPRPAELCVLVVAAFSSGPERPSGCSPSSRSRARYMLREFLSILFTITDWKQQTQVHVAWVPLDTLYNHRLKTTQVHVARVPLYTLYSHRLKTTETGTCCAISTLQALQSQTENNAGIWHRSSVAYNQLDPVLYNQLYFSDTLHCTISYTLHCTIIQEPKTGTWHSIFLYYFVLYDQSHSENNKHRCIWCRSSLYSVAVISYTLYCTIIHTLKTQTQAYDVPCFTATD